MVPISKILRSFAINEDFGIFSQMSGNGTLRNLISLIKKWIRDPLMLDSYFAENVIESISLFIKSSKHNYF